MPYTIDPSSADCYPCTSVLINKFDLRSQQELDRVEAVLVTAKAAQWEESPLCSTFDFEHYKAIHRHLFCDLYEWAGVPRSINTQFLQGFGIILAVFCSAKFHTAEQISIYRIVPRMTVPHCGIGNLR